MWEELQAEVGKLEGTPGQRDCGMEERMTILRWSEIDSDELNAE